MKIVFLTFYYPPDLSAGSFRAVTLVTALFKKISSEDELHVITTHPNRYPSHKVVAEDIETEENITIHRIKVPTHQSGMTSQALTFTVFGWYAIRYCLDLKPDFIIGSTSRLMTGVLTWFSSIVVNRRYFIDLRDIFSETISDLLLLKSRLLSWFSKRVFSFIERRLLQKAAGVNVVSEGFLDYFKIQGMDTSKWTVFTNGVDREFEYFDLHPVAKQPDIKTVLYAGNIGSGQGLDLILPEAALKLGSSFRFQIVGDGSTRKLLGKTLARLEVENVELLLPVGRERLIQYYMKADILFLHLNEVKAFKRVLPSKIFEYAALGKPIVAGLSGYSAKFIAENIEHGCLFNPGDVNGCVECFQNAATLIVEPSSVKRFVKKFSREHIMDKMADQVLYKAQLH